jgi:hypothetical protein
MLQQTGPNLIHDIDEFNGDSYDNRTQISFPRGYFGSRQRLVFLYYVNDVFECA